MAEKQRRIVGADLKLPLQLECRYLRLAGAHHIKPNQPLVQGNVGVFHHRPNAHSERVPTLRALIEAETNLLRPVS